MISDVGDDEEVLGREGGGINERKSSLS
jgi:hypothetical protein